MTEYSEWKPIDRENASKLFGHLLSYKHVTISRQADDHITRDEGKTIIHFRQYHIELQRNQTLDRQELDMIDDAGFRITFVGNRNGEYTNVYLTGVIGN